jgi:hypothetical protein
MCEEDDDCCACCKCSRHCQDRFLVFLVCCVILFVYCSYYLLVVIPFQWFFSFTGLVNLLFFNILVILIVSSYYRAMMTSPGFVPKDWVILKISTKLRDKLRRRLLKKIFFVFLFPIRAKIRKLFIKKTKI